MTLVGRLRENLLPRINPSHLAEHVRHGRVVAWVMVGLLVIWTLADISLALTSRLGRGYRLGYDIAAILVTAAFSAVGLRLLRRHRVVAAGYVLAGGFFLLTVCTGLMFPELVFPITVSYLIPILIAGGLIGGLAPYPFSIGASLGVVLTWVFLRGAVPPQAYAGSTFLGWLFVVAEAFIFNVTAFTLTTLSRQANEIQSALENHTERLTALAHTDPLTGLANRRQLIDLMQREFNRARRYRRPLGLLYLDLDGFKAINDRFGHMFGDEILRNVATTLRAVLRSTDLLARIGGDEFAVLLPETPMPGVENVAAKLHRALASYSQRLGPAVTPLTFCVGASQLSDSDASIDDLLTRADNALLDAKSASPGTTRAQLDSPA
jgi:diguanylate cyclase (GGDEF)-like protein